MVIVAAKTVLKEGRRPAFVALARAMIECTRREAGNISYSLYADTADDRTVLFFEEWESKAHLDAHMQTPHFKEFAAAQADLTDGKDLKIYEVK